MNCQTIQIWVYLAFSSNIPSAQDDSIVNHFLNTDRGSPGVPGRPRGSHAYARGVKLQLNIT